MDKNYEITEKNKYLFQEYKSGNISVLNDILLLNDGLVKNIANKIYKITYSYIEFDDLLQEGRLGLYEAVIRFDVDKGYKFSTYASYWINNYIQNYILNNSKIGTISVYYLSKAFKIQQFMDEYYLKNKVFPTDEQISKELNIKIDAIEELKELLNYEVSMDYISTDDDFEEKNNLLYFLESPINVENDAENKYLHDKLIEIVNSLGNDKYKTIILKRYGLEDNIMMSQQEIANIYNHSRQAIEQSEKRALKKMKIKCLEYGLNAFIN